MYEIRKDKLIEIRKIKIDYSKIQNFPNLRRRPLHHTADKNDSAYVMQDQRLLNYSAFTPFPKKGIFSIFISVYGIFIYEYLKKKLVHVSWNYGAVMETESKHFFIFHFIF